MTLDRRTCLNTACCAIVFLLIIFQLFVPPALSVANDHDFEKILGHLCLGPQPAAGPTYFDYTVFRFHYDPDACIDWPMMTTNHAVFRVALALNHVFYSKTDFDLRWAGVVYGTIFFAGFVTLQRALRYLPFLWDAFAEFVWIAVVCNAVYIPIFNTLYFDAFAVASLTGTLAALGVVTLRSPAPRNWLIAASSWLALFAGAKSQHAPMALIFLPLLWKELRLPVIRIGGTALVIAAVWMSISTTPRFYQGEATFNALFYRILPDVRDPAAYLAETRIPASWVAYSGEVAFADDVPLRDPVYEQKFGEWFGPAALINLYLRHPSAAWIIARENLVEASEDRVRIRMAGNPHRLGNYEFAAGVPPQTISHFFTLWASAKNAVMGARPLTYLAYLLLLIAAAWILAPSPLRWILAAVTVSLAVEFAIAMLDGADGGRHLMLFNFLLDLLFCLDATLGFRRLYVRRVL